jgi:DNA topoisomerase VI subunit B
MFQALVTPTPLSKTAHVPVPKLQSEGVVGVGKSGPVVFSKPSSGNPCEKPTNESNKVTISNVIFFILNFLV